MTSVTGIAAGRGLRDHRVERTEAKADALRTRRWAPNPADAVGASDVTIVNVLDNTVLDSILATTGDAVVGQTIISLTSDTPDRAQNTATLVGELGGHYLDGAIMTPTPTIGTPSASILFRRAASSASSTGQYPQPKSLGVPGAPNDPALVHRYQSPPRHAQHGRPVSITRRAACSRNSGVYFLRLPNIRTNFP